MILDLGEKLDIFVNKIVENAVSQLPLSYPCKVKSVESDGVFVTVETLLKKTENDTETKIPIMQSPYFALPIKEGDIGLALNCSFLFDNLINDLELSENQPSIRENGLFFVPFVSKSKFKGKVGETFLASQDFKSTINLKQEGVLEIKSEETLLTSADSKSTISLKNNGALEIVSKATGNGASFKLGESLTIISPTTIEAKGVSASLGEILSDFANALTLMNAEPVAGNGAPLQSATLNSQMPEILAKIKGNFK